MMNTLLRHKPLPREEDGGSEFGMLKMDFESWSSNYVHWRIRSWIDHLRRGGGHKKSFQYCTDSTTRNYLSPSYPRSFRRKSCGSIFTRQCVDPPQLLWVHLSCRMLLQYALNIESGLIAGGKNVSQDRQAVSSQPCVLCPRIVISRRIRSDKAPNCCLQAKVESNQGAVYWIDIRLVQKKGLKFFQTRSNAITLYVTVPPICIERVVSVKTQEVKYTEIKKSQRPAPTVTLEDNWQKDWSSDAAASSTSIQLIQSNQNDQLASTVRLLTLKDREELDQENTSDVPCPERRDPYHMT